LEYAGRLEAAETVELRSRVSGFLVKVNFREGTAVRQGDLLFEIDPRLYQAAVQKAEAELARSEADLRLADAEAARIMRLRESGTISGEEIARAGAGRDKARAGVIVARAALERAKLDLDSTRITAPISGRIGRAYVTAGNLVKAGETLLGAIIRVDPIR